MKRCPSCQAAYPSDYTHCPRDGSNLATIGEWAEGTLVRGKYRILAKVGQGGMASVYKAMHVRFRETRALKVISPELASDVNFVRRFEQEALITRKLQHPNAVRVEDIDEAEDGRPFIVMEYVEGSSLKDIIEQQAPMTIERVCSIVKQAAAALEAAHVLGLVHRDVKPGNIALVPALDASGAPYEQVKILDFGIVKLKEVHLEDGKTQQLSYLTLTDTGVVIGTPAYMSPEQARGMKGEQVDGRSDIYSLGIVTYQMLTGELPLKADSTIEQLMAHLSTPPKPIRDLRPDIPETLAAVVMKCLEKNRELRPASGQALIDEIQLAVSPPVADLGASSARIEQRPALIAAPVKNVASPTVETATLSMQGEQVRPAISRNGLWLGVAVLVLVVAVGLAYFRRGQPAPPQQNTAPSLAQITKKDVPPAESERPPVPSSPAVWSPPAKNDELSLTTSSQPVSASPKTADAVQSQKVLPPFMPSSGATKTPVKPPSTPASRVSTPTPNLPANSEKTSTPVPPVMTTPSPAPGSAASTPTSHANDAAVHPATSASPAGASGGTSGSANPTSELVAVYRVGGGVSAPSILSAPQPDYTDEARRARKEGNVVLSLVVDTTGRARNLRVVSPLGFGLDEKAIEAVKQWRFQPGLKDGKPVNVQLNIEVEFRQY